MHTRELGSPPWQSLRHGHFRARPLGTNKLRAIFPNHIRWAGLICKDGRKGSRSDSWQANRKRKGGGFKWHHALCMQVPRQPSPSIVEGAGDISQIKTQIPFRKNAPRLHTSRDGRKSQIDELLFIDFPSLDLHSHPFPPFTQNWVAPETSTD